jgi:hypothetical protein
MTEQGAKNARFLEEGFVGMAELKERMPFSMEYETKVNKKEGYNAIQHIFKEAAKAAEKLTFENEADQLADYMMALAICGDLVDEEVFDHYKNLEKAFKAQLYRLADRKKPGHLLINLTDRKAAGEIGRAILKACDAGMILEEKYRALGCELAGMDGTDEKKEAAGK